MWRFGSVDILSGTAYLRECHPESPRFLRSGACRPHAGICFSLLVTLPLRGRRDGSTAMLSRGAATVISSARSAAQCREQGKRACSPGGTIEGLSESVWELQNLCRSRLNQRESQKSLAISELRFNQLSEWRCCSKSFHRLDLQWPRPGGGMAYAGDLKSPDAHASCGFDPHPGHQ